MRKADKRKAGEERARVYLEQEAARQEAQRKLDAQIKAEKLERDKLAASTAKRRAASTRKALAQMAREGS